MTGLPKLLNKIISMKKKNFLKLNRETLVSLQERQMSAILGGAAAMWSKGETAGCPSSDCNDSCCKKSCEKPQQPEQTT